MANLLTILRLLLIPVFIYLAFLPGPAGFWSSSAVFGVAALTDLFDGIVARRTETVSGLGRFLDPLADRLLVVSVLVVLVLKQDVPLWAAAVAVSRDFALMLGYKIVQARGAKPSVSRLGKTSTAVLMVSLALLVLNLPGAVYVFYAGMVLSLASGLQYAVRELKPPGQSRLEGQG